MAKKFRLTTLPLYLIMSKEILQDMKKKTIAVAMITVVILLARHLLILVRQVPIQIHQVILMVLVGAIPVAAGQVVIGKFLTNYYLLATPLQK